ncbi:MAG: hypothetical protein OEY03_18020 [Rhizobacter sp.]|nr:hypothetical protein [Rhizobacter sp.]
MTQAMKYSMLNDDWDVSADGRRYESPPITAAHDEQWLLFSDRIRNGSIEVDVTPLAGKKTRSEELSLEADLVFRYNGPDGFYYAGTSGFDTKFFLAKVLPGPYYQLREYIGRRSAVRAGKTYRLRVTFNGSQIVLYENDVQQLMLRDDAFALGQVGLRTWRTQARFENVRIVPEQPTCFLIMPFAADFKFVHKVISEEVTRYGIRCIRADEVYLSRPVMDDVKQMIAAADLVIVDFTGRNPNVYYEAGLADAWRKDWIVLSQTSEDMTFDVRHIRSIRYSNTMCADEQLREELAKALVALGYRAQDNARPGSVSAEADVAAGGLAGAPVSATADHKRAAASKVAPAARKRGKG